MQKTFFVFYYLLISSTFCQTPLEKEFNTLLTDKDLASAHIGFSVVNTTTLKPIYEHQSIKWFSTASSLKLLTTAAALNNLGEKYKFKTQIYTDSDLINGQMLGNLVISGTGDPTFASSRYGKTLEQTLESIVSSLKKLNIKSIQGHICFDVSKFDINPVSPKTYWLDLGNYFGGAVWPVNINENVYKVTFSRSMRTGDSTKIINIEPNIGLRLENKVTIGGKSDEAYIYCAPYATYGYIKGTLPPSAENYTIKGAMPNPLDYFGAELIKALHKAQISVSENVKLLYHTPPVKTSLWEYSSPSIEEIVKQTNWYSINIYAEALLRAIAFQKTGMALTENGVAVLGEFIDSMQVAERHSQLSIHDGSGISPANMCSPRLMSQVLAKIYNRKGWFLSFYNSLSSSGGGGTLANMGKGTILEGKLRAKSGNMDGVSSYAGYITTKSKGEVSFAIFINNFNAENSSIKKKIEKVLTKVAEL